MTHVIDRKRSWWHDPKLLNWESGECRAKQTSSDWQRDAELFLNTAICQSLSGWIDRKGFGDRIENYSTGKACKQTSDWQRNTELSLNMVLPQYHNTMVPQCHNTTVPQWHAWNCCRARWCDASNRTTELIERNDGSCMAKLWCDCSAGKKDWQYGQRILDQDPGSQIKD